MRFQTLFGFGLICVLGACNCYSLTVAQEIVVRPRYKPGSLDNPLKGWCPYTNAGPIYQPYSMVFQYISWRELEPKQGEYQFEKWERSWDSKLGKNKHIVFRVFIDYPSQRSGLPDWLRQAGVQETDYDDYGGGKSPQYNDEKMLAAMEHLIAALGKRYNTNPRVAFIQLGLLGFWGEWHTYPQPKLYATPATEQRVIEAYRKAFPDKKLMVRYARDFAGQQEWLGFHDDMFPEDTDNGQDWSFLAGIRREGRSENWKRAVVGGEMVPGKAGQWLGANYEKTLEMVERSHFTWVGPYCPALESQNSATFSQRSEELVRKMGYEFQITEVTHAQSIIRSEPLSLRLKGKNIGVAPFYYPWVVEWGLLDTSGKVVAVQPTKWDIRLWLPGEFQEQTQLQFDVPAGKYRLALGIRDPWTHQPAIGLANDVTAVDGWQVLSELEVKKQ
jgi:hypothetical protein